MSDYQKMGLRKNPFQQLLPETTLQRPVHFGVSPILRGRNGGGSAPKCENSELCFPNAEIPIFFVFFLILKIQCPIHWTRPAEISPWFLMEPFRRLRLMQHLDSLEVGVPSRSKGSEMIGSLWICTWWLIPLSKWVIIPVINGISRVNPLKSLGL